MSIESPNFTQIPNSVFDYWIPRLKPASSLVLVVMCRKIFGWHKTSDHISKNQLCKATGLSKNTVQAAIEELESFNLILKYQFTNEYGCQPNTYSLNVVKPIDLIYSEADQNLGGAGSKSDLGVGQNLTGGVGQNLTPQKKDSTKEILTKEKEGEEQAPPRAPASSKKKKKESEPEPVIIPFGSYVMLKEGEYEALCTHIGKELTDYYIEAINNYVPNNGPYKDYAATIRSWHLRDKAKGSLPSTQNLQGMSEPVTDRIDKNKRICEAAEVKLQHRFNAYVYFQAGPHKACLVDNNKGNSKEYVYDKIDTKTLKELLLRDLESAFHGARDILMGLVKKNSGVSDLIAGLATQNAGRN